MESIHAYTVRYRPSNFCRTETTGTIACIVWCLTQAIEAYLEPLLLEASLTHAPSPLAKFGSSEMGGVTLQKTLRFSKWFLL